MQKKHDVQICIGKLGAKGEKVMESSIRKLPMRLLRLLFGDFVEILVLKPGQTVDGVIIRERRGYRHETV